MAPNSCQTPDLLQRRRVFPRDPLMESQNLVRAAIPMAALPMAALPMAALPMAAFPMAAYPNRRWPTTMPPALQTGVSEKRAYTRSIGTSSTSGYVRERGLSRQLTAWETWAGMICPSWPSRSARNRRLHRIPRSHKANETPRAHPIANHAPAPTNHCSTCIVQNRQQIDLPRAIDLHSGCGKDPIGR